MKNKLGPLYTKIFLRFRYSTLKPRSNGDFLDHFDILGYVRIRDLSVGDEFSSHYRDENIGENRQPGTISWAFEL